MVDTDDTRRTIHDGRQTTPRVWHKLPTGELKKLHIIISIAFTILYGLSDLMQKGGNNENGICSMRKQDNLLHTPVNLV